MKKVLFLFVGTLIGVPLMAMLIAVAACLLQPPPPEDPAISQARTLATLADIQRQQTTSQFWAEAIPAAFVIMFAVTVAYLCLRLWHGHHDAQQTRAIALAQAPFIPMLLDNLGNPTPYIDAATRTIMQALPGNAPPSNLTTLTYSPHTTRAATLDSPKDEPQLATPTASVPPFAQLLADGAIQPGKLLLGYREGGAPEYGTWKQLFSSIIAGLSGQGKTVTVSFLAAQSALSGGQFVILDPHQDAGAEGLASILAPLASQFVCHPANDDPNQIAAAIALAKQELHRRTHGDPTRTPYIFAVDELTKLMRGDMAKPLAGLLQDISQEGRKVGIFALAMGQVWKGTTSGGTEVRDSFASAYVHRLKRNQARLLLPAEEARQVERLHVGQALFYSTTGDIYPLTIPLTTGDDMATVASMISNTPTTFSGAPVAPKSSESRQKVAVDEPTTRPSERDKVQPAPPKARSAEEVRIIDLFANGNDIAAIVKEVYGEVQGANATKARAEIQAIIRAFVTEQYKEPPTD